MSGFLKLKLTIFGIACALSAVAFGDSIIPHVLANNSAVAKNNATKNDATKNNANSNPNNSASEQQLPCSIIIAGSHRQIAVEALPHSKFTRLNGLNLYEYLGSITAIKDMDTRSQGRLFLATTSGVVVAYTPKGTDHSRVGATTVTYHPFAGLDFGEIWALRVSVGRGTLKRALALAWTKAAVLMNPGWTVLLPTQGYRVLNANFVPGDEAVVVTPKAYLVYDLPNEKDEPPVLKATVPAQTKFEAAAINETTGQIVALDGHDLVTIQVSGEPEEIGVRKVIAHVDKPVDRIVMSDLGTRFYLRKGSQLTFYDLSGKNYGSVDVEGSLQSAAWDHSEKYFAFSSHAMTAVYDLETQKLTQVGTPGDQWRRLAWIKDDGLLLTLGIDKSSDSPSGAESSSEFWSAEIWNPETGKKLAQVYRKPLSTQLEPYPHLADLRGSLAIGDFQFYIVEPDGQYSIVAQSPDLDAGRPKSKVIAIPTYDEQKRVLN